MQLAIFGASAATYNMIVVLDLNSSSTSPKEFSLGYGVHSIKNCQTVPTIPTTRVVGIVGTVWQFCVDDSYSCHPDVCQSEAY